MASLRVMAAYAAGSGSFHRYREGLKIFGKEIKRPARFRERAK
jgi:hypothetical protein